MNFNILFYVSIILISGLLFGRIAKFIKLPNVTGYLLAGLILGPYILNILPSDVINNLYIIPDIALAFIAFSIGSEFKISYFKRVGFTPIVIAIMEAMVAVILVTSTLILTGHDIAFSIVLGAISAATAPAATIMVIKQYKARGPVTETLMSVVAMDDAVALIAFGFAVTIAKSLGNSASPSIIMSIFNPFIEIGLALLIGIVVGFLLKLPLKWFNSRDNKLIVVIGFVFLSTSLANYFNVSSLLTCMAMGGIFTNIYSDSNSIMQITDSITPPIFLMFFVISGAELDITIIPKLGLVGIIYILVRVIGKLLGSYLGGKIMNAPKNVQKFLGPTLIPQAGVAIGLTSVAESVVPEFASMIKAVILCATLIYEIVGPAITKITLQKAGEINN